MENRFDRLSRLAELAESTSLRDREQIDRIISSVKEAATTAQQTADVLKRMMGRTSSQP